MPIQLGKDATTTLPGVTNDNIVNVSWTEECELIEVTARGNQGFKSFHAGFTSANVEVECTAHSASIGKSGSWEIVGISSNEPLDGPVTYTITYRKASTK